MTYQEYIEKLASNQYERFTRRKWASTSDAERQLWYEGAKKDLAALGINDSSIFSNAIIPKRIKEDDAKKFRNIFCDALNRSGLNVALVEVYRAFVDGAQKSES